MAIDELFIVTLHGRWYGNNTRTGSFIDCYNVFHYRQVADDTEGAELLGEVFIEDVCEAALQPLFGQNYNMVSVEVRNPYNGPSYAFDTINLVGTRNPTSQIAPPFLAASVYTDRPYPGTRSGRKRFACLWESDLGGLSLVNDSGVIDALGLVASALSVPLQAVASDTWLPVVCGRQSVPPHYPIVSYDVEQYNVDTRVSTQNTRKS